jgi:hypothetical protein
MVPVVGEVFWWWGKASGGRVMVLVVWEGFWWLFPIFSIF